MDQWSEARVRNKGKQDDFTTAKTARFRACRQGIFEGVKNDPR